MKKLFLVLFLSFMASTQAYAAGCNPPYPTGLRGHPIQVEFYAWYGTITFNRATLKSTVTTYDGTVIGTFNVQMINEQCSNTYSMVHFKVLGVGDGNTQVMIEWWSGQHNFYNQVLWYGNVYARNTAY